MWDFVQKILVALIQAGATFGAVYFGGKLAIDKFHSEKRWERKEVAYIELLRALQAWIDYDTASKRESLGNSISDSEWETLEADHEAAYNVIRKAIQLGEWDLSEDVVNALRDVRIEARRIWHEAIEEDRSVDYEALIKVYTDTLLSIKAYAKSELRK
ncbi:hypothetical protein [Verrucomicrobium sp. BvORR106]|uniref:hypothetical protein n=1 Tax=Verrucomicrobium sp. BvORR106 TaxID=1403819 RepID=UPI002241048A|nr:hypothetical protein [Verrucomicrobium sp. BvORR106]